MKSITFYKVGHHGSHNATPRRFVEEFLPATACAMVPTDNVKQWPLIPKKELLDFMRQKGVPFVRSDAAGPGDDARFRRQMADEHTLYVEVDLPTG